MDKKALTLVEIMIVVTILAILGLISFIYLQGFTIDTRDAKRISDVEGLFRKITIENGMGVDYSQIINAPEKTILKINGEENKEGYQSIEAPINWKILKESGDNFKDPTNGHPYPFAYAEGNANGIGYSFIQLAYVEEKTGATRLVGNYYEMEPGDSPSLFKGCIGEGNENEIIKDGSCPIYDIGVTYEPSLSSSSTSSSGGNPQPTSCPAGQYLNGMNCENVGYNNYSGEGEKEMHSCPDGGITETTTAISITECKKLNQACKGLPNTTAYEWYAETITQTYNGTSYQPNLEGAYLANAVSGQCKYKCATNYVYNGTTCEANSYTITIDENGGGAVSDLSYSISTSQQTKTLTPPARTGYTFKDWTITTQATGGTTTITGNTLTIPANIYGNITIKANWNVVSYTISYSANNGTLSGCIPTGYTIESAVITPSCTTKTRNGYTFSSFSPTSITTGSIGNKTFTANWSANSYTITIDENGGGAVSDLSYTTSTSQQTKTLTQPARNNSTFSSWSISANTSGSNSSISGNTLTIPINAYGNIIIKANYTCNSGYYENGTNCNMLSLTTRTFYDCDKNVTGASRYGTGAVYGEGVVYDSCTGLYWQQDGSTSGTKAWEVAKTYCANLILGTYTDWRLPDITELLSIIKLDVYSPSIDTTYFTNTASSYWSSITGGSFETTAWLVNFNDGYSDWDGKVTGRYVRCVR